MRDVFGGRKNNSCNVSKLVVHVLHAKFAKGSFEIWNAMPIFRIKEGVG